MRQQVIDRFGKGPFRFPAGGQGTFQQVVDPGITCLGFDLACVVAAFGEFVARR